MSPHDPDDLLRTLRELLDRSPDLRLGQLVLNLAYMARGVSSEAPYDVEDAELLAAARQLIANLQGRQVSVP